ncbi:MAG: DUF6198 family protein [Oscillospiraceae bacterium]|nr:DUF6198 family protein [Oscillospiraceae bacterium]
MDRPVEKQWGSDGYIAWMRETQLVRRILLYTFAMFVMAIGVVFNINAGLGVSAISVLPLVYSLITGFSLGTSAFFIFSIFALLQILILRRDFQWIHLTQLLISRLLGYFVDAAEVLFGTVSFPGYLGQLLMLGIGIVCIACGIVLHLQARLVPLPPAALVTAIVKKCPRFLFFRVKMVMDCTLVALAALLSFLFLGGIYGLREGTVIAALLVGRCVPLVSRVAVPTLKKLGFRNVGAI